MLLSVLQEVSTARDKWKTPNRTACPETLREVPEPLARVWVLARLCSGCGVETVGPVGSQPRGLKGQQALWQWKAAFGRK